MRLKTLYEEKSTPRWAKYEAADFYKAARGTPFEHSGIVVIESEPGLYVVKIGSSFLSDDWPQSREFRGALGPASQDKQDMYYDGWKVVIVKDGMAYASPEELMLRYYKSEYAIHNVRKIGPVLSKSEEDAAIIKLALKELSDEGMLDDRMLSIVGLA
jgi:hypothetical protein